jgi:phospholipid transport system transporter-binding protein
MQLPAIATLDEAAALAAMLPAAIADGGSGAVPIDASALQSFDTSVLALLLQARRLAQAAGRHVEITGAPAKLAELAQLYGVEELLSLSASPRPSAPPSAP